jgi:hypothetical protein
LPRKEISMPFFVVVLLMKIVVEAIRAFRRVTVATKPETLCVRCQFAHVQYAVNAKRAISCGFGGALRAISLDVLYCTDFKDRNVPEPVRIVGFVHEIMGVE